MIKLRWNDTWVQFERVEWSGTENQCSRQISFTLPKNPYDKGFQNVNVKLGDLIYLYNGKTKIFVGTVTSRTKDAEIGSAEYVAMDFMHHLLRSNGTYKFKNTTPEKITKKVCNDVQVKTSTLAKSSTNIQKMFVEDQCVYDIIVKAYRYAKANTGKKYMPTMNGSKVSVIVKGQSSKVVLEQGIDIISATYSDTTDNMVNKVVIYNDKLKKLGQVQNKNNIAKYGVYQQTYTKEKGVNAKTAAKGLLTGIVKEASVEAIGNINAVAGKSIEIKDKATGLVGTFYIASDTHVFENGVHTMTLELVWKNTMEQGADVTSAKVNTKKSLTNASKCYYLSTSNYYHSSTSCSACKGKKNNTSTVAKMKKIKNTKGKKKYKACSKCWR